MSDEFVSEVKKVKSTASVQNQEVPRDPTMKEGERAESPEEKRRREETERRPKEAPIIQKDVT